MTNFEKMLQKIDINDCAYLIEFHACEICPVFETCESFSHRPQCKDNILKWLKAEADND